jgi:hypothetical protein
MRRHAIRFQQSPVLIQRERFWEMIAQLFGEKMYRQDQAGRADVHGLMGGRDVPIGGPFWRKSGFFVSAAQRRPGSGSWESTGIKESKVPVGVDPIFETTC